MGQFLRDKKIESVNIDEDVLKQLDEVIGARLNEINNQILLAVAAPAPAPAAAGAPAAVAPQVPALQNLTAAQLAEFNRRSAWKTYVIRFDGKGYRFADFAEVQQHYVAAETVERVAFEIFSGEHRHSNGFLGTAIDLRLDTNGWLTVTADNKQWVEATFAAINEVLARHSNWSGLARTQWAAALIQLTGVGAGFVVSVWAALIIAPLLKIENAFAVALLFAILLFSNAWGYLQHLIARLINAALPDVRFKRKNNEGYRWLWRSLVGAAIFAVSVFVLKKLIELAGHVLGTLVK